MDPTTQYLAAANSANLRRHRALYRSIVASPFVLMLAVGLVGHIHGKAHFQPAGSRDYDRRVLAYRDRVVAVEAALGSSQTSSSDLEREAQRWISGFASGDLTSLTPAYYEDHLRDGSRGEVLRAGLALSTALSVRADEALEGGKVVEGARDSLLAAETSHGLRNFEISGFLQCLLTSRRGLSVLASAWPHLPTIERNALRPQLRALTIAPKEIDALQALDRDQRDDYQSRQGSASLQSPGIDLRLQRSMRMLEVSTMERSVRVNNARIKGLIDDAPATTSLR